MIINTVKKLEHQLGINSLEYQIKRIRTENESSANIINKARKINGRFRLITQVKENCQLYIMQKAFVEHFLKTIQISSCAYGFVSNKSYLDFLNHHIIKNDNNKTFLRLDLYHFFNNFNKEMVISSLVKETDIFDKNEIAIFKEFIELTCFQKNVIPTGLPTGFVTSPYISNICFRRVDLRIQKYANKIGMDYSRYADDLLFSWSNNLNVSRVIKGIAGILREAGFKINGHKTSIQNGELSLNGYVLDSSIRLSNKKLAPFKNILFILEQNIHTIESNKDNLLDKINKPGNKKYFRDYLDVLKYLSGYRSFLISLLPYSNSNFIYNKIYPLLNRNEKIMDILYNVQFKK